jgi:hypothetical protein
MKLTIAGTLCSATSVYLLFFDKIPFGAPWGVLFGFAAILCYKQVLKERFKS